ncbi:MAG: dihydrofolate reductase [Gammaproteobacteria bacterium]|jgi:dihydrofolate reductase
MKHAGVILVRNISIAMENNERVISHLVAVSNNNAIGVNNDLPWNLKSDLAHFKKYTLNKSIIMGRKTYESIGRPLPNRNNIIISRTLKDIPGAYVYSDLESAIKFVEEKNKEENIDNEIVIIGGGYLFRDTIESFNKLILTRVDCEIDGDIFYPDIDLNNWRLISSNSFKKDADNDYDYKIEEYKKL